MHGTNVKKNKEYLRTLTNTTKIFFSVVLLSICPESREYAVVLLGHFAVGLGLFTHTV